MNEITEDKKKMRLQQGAEQDASGYGGEEAEEEQGRPEPAGFEERTGEVRMKNKEPSFRVPKERIYDDRSMVVECEPETDTRRFARKFRSGLKKCTVTSKNDGGKGIFWMTPRGDAIDVSGRLFLAKSGWEKWKRAITRGEE